MTPSDPLHIRFAANYSYPVIFTEHAFAQKNPTVQTLFKRAFADSDHPLRVRAFLDEGLVNAQPDLPDQIASYGSARVPPLAETAPRILPGGERIKNEKQYVETIVNDLAEHRLCRHSVVVAVGGGAFLDAVGFAASLFHRGVRLLRLPSTVLSQDDSGIGTKNGINAGGQKNLLGTFMPPWAVVNDFAMLRTLDRELVLDGVAEAFKVAIIKDADFFDSLAEQAAELSDPAGDALRTAVRRSAELHADHIVANGDPFETGTARPLDFGHWAAHRLESLSGYRIRHGQAVAIGLALDGCYAESVQLISTAERQRIHRALRTAGLRIWHPLLESRDSTGRLAVLEGIEHFREHLGGTLSVTFPSGIGDRIELHELDEERIRRAIQSLKNEALRPSGKGVSRQTDGNIPN